MFPFRALKYMPHAVLKLMENMPMPWEQIDPRCQSTVPPHGSHHVCQRDSLGHRTSVHCSVGVSYQSIGECHTAQTVRHFGFKKEFLL